MNKLTRLTKLEQILSDICYYMSCAILVLAGLFFIICFIEAHFESIPTLTAIALIAC